MLTKSMTMTLTLGFLPLPAWLSCSPAQPADAHLASLCSVLVFPLPKTKTSLETPEYFAGPQSRLPEPWQHFLLRKSPLFMSSQLYLELA